jgi:hypothetical protein
MKKKIFITVSLTLFVGMFLFSFSTIPTDNAGQFKYVGVAKCAPCHKSEGAGKQFDIWQGSKHSQAWKTLETPEADKVAKDKGFTTKASETPQCIKCHVLGKDIDPSELAETFDKTQGVQCETCHGPGSEYKKTMTDQQKAVENGLFISTTKEDFCLKCHNSESPSYKDFNFEERWAQIKHYKLKN